MLNRGAFLIFSFLIISIRSGVVPTAQIMLYPNTDNSPSLYLISFKTSIDLKANQYILVSMDWLSADISPYSCILINTSIKIRCTNLFNPSFTFGFAISTLTNFNPQLSLTRAIVIQLLDPLPSLVEYKLQIGLLNLVENMKKISPSMQIYCISNNGLIHEQNLNFGPVAYKPPITNVLSVSIYTDPYNLAQGVPGALVTLKVQVAITVPAQTEFSSIIFVLQDPFEFSQSSYVIVHDAQQYATNPILINSKPNVTYQSVISPHIFYVAFNETFVANRRFIIQVTEIKNPFFIANSNVSIYTANFNSLTPLQAFESLLPLKTVTQQLTLSLGLPYSMPMNGPCVFYRDDQNYYQIKFNMPLDVPAGYAIKVFASQNTILDGTGFVDFQSTNYETVYDYFTSDYFIMKQMGPIFEGSLITIIFKAKKNLITNFYIDVYIDTQQVIYDGTATSYMFFGRVNGVSVTGNSFLSTLYSYQSSVPAQSSRVSTSMTSSDSLRLIFNLGSSTSTSTGSYIQMYFSPEVQFAASFNQNTDCLFGSNPGSAVCTRQKTANYVYIQFSASTAYLGSNPNPFPSSNTNIQINIFNILFPRPSSNKYPYHIYIRLFNSSAANPTTYIQSQSFSVLPPPNVLVAAIQLTQQGNINTTNNFKYPGFIRFACLDPTVMDYLLQENQVKVVSIFSTYGMRGLSTYKNQDEYPCSSNINIQCIFRKGILANGNLIQSNRFSQLQRIDIFFKANNSQTTTKFQVIIPDGINVGAGGSNYNYFYMIGKYNKFTKVFTYSHRNSGFTRNPGWADLQTTLNSGLVVDFQGKAGSYRSDMLITVQSTGSLTSQNNYLVMSSAWSLFENGKSTYSADTIASTNPSFFSDQKCPLSVYMGQGMYISVYPYVLTSTLSSFTFKINNYHMPYHYDLPNFYIYTISGSTYDVKTFNQFQMTNQNIFYGAYVNSLTINCVKNSVGVKNTICTVTVGSQSPLKADGKITLVFTGINVATDLCSISLTTTGQQIQSSCISTSDNKNVTISMVDSLNKYHYPAQNFTITLHGISILADQIAYSVTVYLLDPTGTHIIQQGTRILTTTVSIPQNIQIYQITFDYSSPLAANKMNIKFSLPRGLYPDQRMGLVLGKDLSDVNLEVARIRIELVRADGVQLKLTYELISDQYKILFRFDDQSLLVVSDYTFLIYGIMTPVSLENGVFSIIYQREFDTAYTLTNAVRTVFPEFNDRIISNITMQSFFNTQGHQQKIVFSIANSQKNVNDKMVWIINFPSYYNIELFNYNPYCQIDSTPIQCASDPTTPYQLIIKNSPKNILSGTAYTITIHRLACPRAKYTNDYYPSYYLFIGILETSASKEYVETALLYPEQNIQSLVNGIITVVDLTVNSLLRPTFSTIYAIIQFNTNVAISANSYLYIIYPNAFDNFNNQPINYIFKRSGNILFSGTATVIDRTLQIQITTSLTANSQFTIQFPSLPTPKLPTSVVMSKMICYITDNTKMSITAASSMSGNSAPIVTFSAGSRYISFNSNTPITITAGTYSPTILITPSDGNPFLTNINVNLTSTGFIFEPSTAFLRLGDTSAKFRVGADNQLFPVSYFYDTIKTEEVFTYYTITKNNDIVVTNTPVTVTIPTSIDVPIGGCSIPFTVDIINNPVYDVQITFNYPNQIYTQQIFWPNQYTTKSQLPFTPQNKKNTVSFCVSSNFASLSLPSTFTLKFLFAGTNYKSYQFSPSPNVTINIVPSSPPVPIPTLSITLFNRQKTFTQFTITTSVPGIVYYHLQLGQDVSPLSLITIQLHTKNNQYIIESNDDFLTKVYSKDRDLRTGMVVRAASGSFVLKQQDMLPERYYTLCAYLVTFYNVVTQPKCLTIQTQVWGQVMKARLRFSSNLTAQNLNKVLCYFTKLSNTKVDYVIDLEGNSCYDKAVKNLNFRYSGLTYSSQTQTTNIYLLANPYLSSDSSLSYFQNLFNATTSQLSTSSLNSALSQFAISYLSATYLGSQDAIGMTSGSNADDIGVQFDDPVYEEAFDRIVVGNIRLTSPGTVYFLLVLYKQVSIDRNNSYVKIRLNTSPTQQQILQCLNWQNLPAQGCARAVYTSINQNVVFPNIQPNSMYMLYYVTASQYPLRPIVGSTVLSDSVVTFIYQGILTTWAFVFLFMLATFVY